MELYIVRHGQTIWNASRKIQGRTDIELNENGREMARQLGEHLKDVSFDCIYSSPLLRAYETACLIRGDREIPIIREDRLKEISFGIDEGTCTDIWFQNAGKNFFDHPEKYVPAEQGETFSHLCDRAKGFLDELIQHTEYNRIMIVAHGALNKGLMYWMEGNTPERFWGDGLQKNCEASIFQYDNGKWIRLKA